MKIGDLVQISTYRNSGDIEAIGIFVEYLEHPDHPWATVHVRGVECTFPVYLLKVINEGR